MVRNYLIIAWRNLVRYKVYSAINIAGLAIGLAACMLIVLYVGHESSYDSFHKNADRIFWIQTKLKLGKDSVFMPYLNYSAAPMAIQREPSVKSFLRLRNGEKNTIISNPANLSLKFAENNFLFADSNFFNFFSFKLLAGNKEQALINPFSVVLSQKAAKKYFGNNDPIGKILRYNNAYDLLVTGVAENQPSNSTIKYDLIASLSSIKLIKEQSELVTREKNDFTTYFQVSKPEKIVAVENTLRQIIREKESDDPFRYVSTPLTGLHEASATDISNLKYLKTFPFVAALVLLLALINYMSLSTARSSVRAKEIGVRKVTGASRRIIATQFFVESALYTSISFVLAYILCNLLQPFFFDFLQINIDQSFLYHPLVLLSLTGLFIVTVVIAGIYPSLLLSAYKPIAVLYGRTKQAGGISARKFFTVFQFTIAVVFIISGIVIQKQLHFFRHKDTGIDRENIVMMPFGSGIAKYYTAFKQDINAIPGTQKISVALHPLFKGYDMMGITPPGSNAMMLMPTLDVDQQFISLLDLKWKLQPQDSLFYKKKGHVIVNETAIEKMGLEQNPLNQKVDQFEVAGVLKDFNWSSLQNKIDGLIISVEQDDDSAALWANRGGCLFVKIDAGTNIPTFIDRLEGIQRKYNAENPFEYYFMDETFNNLYKAEDRLAKILSSFTVLAIIIACLGLLGLTTFMITQRIKEIGIRKTLGASMQSIIKLLSVDFLILVIVAVVIASPVAWYFMNRWLQDFAYRVNIGWSVFVIAAIAAIFVALITVSFQAIRAAIANPIKSLRTE
jgi:putative ABC transport system permease protein